MISLRMLFLCSYFYTYAEKGWNMEGFSDSLMPQPLYYIILPKRKFPSNKYEQLILGTRMISHIQYMHHLKYASLKILYLFSCCISNLACTDSMYL